MKVLVLDLEYTGHVVWKEADGKTVVRADDPRQPRIAQAGWTLYDGAIANVLNIAEYKVRPDGWTMPDELAEKLGHGLTTANLMRHGVPIADVLDAYKRDYDRCDVLVGFNFQGDLKLIRGEQRRLGRDDTYKEKTEIDVMRKATPLCAIPPTEAMIANKMRTKFKTPSLTEAGEILLGLAHPARHNALADCDMTARLFFWLLENGHIPPLDADSAAEAVSATPEAARAAQSPTDTVGFLDA